MHRRSPDRRLLPGTWDIVGGHVEPGESPEAALAREIEEETGWRLRRIEAIFAEWEWDVDGTPRRETDYLVELDGDLTAPRLEAGQHDASAWVGQGDLELLMAGRADGALVGRGGVSLARVDGADRYEAGWRPARPLRDQRRSRVILAAVGGETAEDDGHPQREAVAAV